MNKLKLLLLIAPLWTAEATTIYPDELVGRISDSTRVNHELNSFSLSVEGTIDSFTVRPFFFDLSNPGAELFLPFEMGYYGHSEVINSTQWYQLLPTPAPLTVSLFPLYSQIDFRVTADFGEAFYFKDYFPTHPDAELFYGFSVLSVEYTPSAHVPEGGSTLGMLVLGLLGCIYARRK